ncbi:MAG: selenocysteine-specific translation elongation factor [Phycisphaeraceae bacterium]
MPPARKNIMLGTAGHVDHGKTSLVKLLTGCDTDRLAEEKARGMTIELGFAPCRMADDRIVGIVDVPGHVSFIRNMVAGAHGVDVMILVVAADDGVMPQTREHLDVLTLMGARQGLIALTKIDLVDAEMRELATAELRDFLKGTFLADAPICPMSNLTGAGFDEFFAALEQQVSACVPRPGADRGPLRQWVERSFTAHGFGVVASGIPSGGRVQLGDGLRVVPGGRRGQVRGRVRRLQVYGENADSAGAGECVAVNLADVDLADVPRGVLLTSSDTLEAVQYAAAQMRLLSRLKRPLKDGTQVHLHVGTAHGLAKVALLQGGPLLPGAQTLVQLYFDRPLPVTPGDRFVIRLHVDDQGGLTTIGGGRILATHHPRLRRKRPEILAALAARAAAIDSPPAWCLALLIEADTPRTSAELAAAAHLLQSEVEAIIAPLRSDGLVIDVDSRRLVARATLEEIADRMVTYLSQYHADHSDQQGVGLGGLTAALACDPAVTAAASQILIDRRVASWQGDLLALATHRPLIDAADGRLLDAIAHAYRPEQMASPRPAELALALHEPVKRIERLIQLLIDRRELVRLTDQIIMHRQAVDAAEAVVRALFVRSASGGTSGGTSGGVSGGTSGGTSEGRFTTAEYRDALGISRKYVIPLLDYFDRTRLTVRHGSVRTRGAKLREPLPQG